MVKVNLSTKMSLTMMDNLKIIKYKGMAFIKLQFTNGQVFGKRGIWKGKANKLHLEIINNIRAKFQNQHIMVCLKGVKNKEKEFTNGDMIFLSTQGLLRKDS